MHALGYQAVTFQAGYGTSFGYLTPEYFAFIKQFVSEAKQRNMRLWIVDDAGYPSGFAGGKFSAEHPELRMQALAITSRAQVNGGDTFRQAVTPDTVAIDATSDDGTSVAISFTGANVEWKAPAGHWTVAVIEHRFMTSPTRSDTNPKRVKDGSQSLEDYLDPAATAQYLAFTHDQYKKYVGEEFGKTILGFRGDEPDYSISGLPWTPAFFDTFQQAKGYDVRPYVAAILTSQTARGQAPAKLTPAEQRAKADYYDVFSQMFRDGFFKPQGVWCAAHNVEYQVHLNHEELEMELTRSEGDFMRDMKYVENPGIDAIWHQIWTDTVSDYPRLASSASHLYGHPRSFTESFAAYRPAPDITQARYILNEQLVRGVNLFETMFYPATSPSGRGGPSEVMRDPGWPALMQYIQRMSYMLSMGRPAASVALYLPSDSMWMNDAKSDQQFVAAERMLSEHQVDFDIVGVDALASDLQPGNGTLTSASGNAYRTVLLPAPSVLSNAAAGRLRAFAAGGGHVIFLGNAPALLYDRAIEDGHAPRPGELSFATIIEGELPAVPTPPAQPPTSAPDPQVLPAAMLAGVMKALGSPSVTLDSPDPAVKVMTRRLKDADVFLFFNEGASPIAHSVTLKAEGKTVDVWDPITGAVSPLASKPDQGPVTLKLQLAPYETRLLTIR
jgi:hypothetical protein